MVIPHNLLLPPSKRHSPSLDFDSDLSEADTDEVGDEVDIEISSSAQSNELVVFLQLLNTLDIDN